MPRLYSPPSSRAPVSVHGPFRLTWETLADGYYAEGDHHLFQPDEGDLLVWVWHRVVTPWEFDEGDDHRFDAYLAESGGEPLALFALDNASVNADARVLNGNGLQIFGAEGAVYLAGRSDFYVATVPIPPPLIY